jgi:hypothetical protein
MSDPAVWLTRHLAAVEETAKAAEEAAPSPWISYEDQGIVEHSGPDSDSYLNYERGNQLWDTEGCREGWRRLCMDEAVAAHVAGTHPAMVLRLVAATRRLLEWHAGNHECVSAEDNCVWVTEPACESIKELAKGWGWTDE